MPVKFESLDPETKRRVAEMIGQAEPPRKRRRDRKRRKRRVVVIHRVVKTPKATKVVSGLAVKKAKEPKMPSPEEAISPGPPNAELLKANPHDVAPGPGPALAFFAVAVLILLIVAIGYTFGVRLASGGQPSQAVSAVAPKEVPKPSEPEQALQNKEAQPAPARPGQPSRAPVEQVDPAPNQPEPSPAHQSPAPVAVDWGALEKQLAKYVYRVTSPTRKAGTGFLVTYQDKKGNRWGDVISAYHIVEGVKGPWPNGEWLQRGDGSRLYVISSSKPIRVEGIDGSQRMVLEVQGGSARPQEDIVYLCSMVQDEFPRFPNHMWKPALSAQYFEGAPPMGTAADLKVGEQVLILGNPLDMWEAGKAGPIAVIGRVAAIGIPFDPIGTPNVKWGIKLEVPVSPGNSGSPVFNSKGEVVGMVIAGGAAEVNPQTGVKHFTAYATPVVPLFNFN